MMLGLYISSLSICFYQDVKYRGIHWLLFPVILLSGFFINSKWNLQDTISNVFFVVGILGLLSLYLSVKHGEWVNITKGFFAWGDILFLFALTPVFTFSNYVFFFTVGTIATLIIHGVVLIFKQEITVPFAGYLALLTIPYLLFQDQIHQLIMNA